jgi:hypothetical protein
MKISYDAAVDTAYGDPFEALVAAWHPKSPPVDPALAAPGVYLPSPGCWQPV